VQSILRTYIPKEVVMQWPTFFKNWFGGKKVVAPAKRVFIVGTPEEVHKMGVFMPGVTVVTEAKDANVILLRDEDLDEGYESRYPNAKRYCLVTTTRTDAAKRAKDSGVIHDYFVMSNTVPVGLKEAVM